MDGRHRLSASTKLNAAERRAASCSLAQILSSTAERILHKRVHKVETLSQSRNSLLRNSVEGVRDICRQSAAAHESRPAWRRPAQEIPGRGILRYWLPGFWGQARPQAFRAGGLIRWSSKDTFATFELIAFAATLRGVYSPCPGRYPLNTSAKRSVCL